MRPELMFTAAQAAQKLRVHITGTRPSLEVHCRTGSSEIHRADDLGDDLVHCRTGSSENFVLPHTALG